MFTVCLFEVIHNISRKNAQGISWPCRGSDEHEGPQRARQLPKSITLAILEAAWELAGQTRDEVRFTTAASHSWRAGDARQRQARRLHPLLQPNSPIAFVEAKDNLHPMAAGMQQTTRPHSTFPWVFATEGDGVFDDKTRKERKARTIPIRRIVLGPLPP